MVSCRVRMNCQTLFRVLVSSRDVLLENRSGKTFHVIQRCLRSERSSVVRWVKALRQANAAVQESFGGNTHPPQQPLTAAVDLLPLSRPNNRRRTNVAKRGDRSRIVTVENQHDKLSEAVTPLVTMPYEDQLVFKHKLNREILRQLGDKLKQAKSPAKRQPSGLPCDLRDIIPSPVLDEYRNKDEFCVKSGADGNPKTVGCLVGQTGQGTAVCVDPSRLVNTRSSHKRVAAAFQEYIRQSPLPMCDLFHEGGNWRGITVRSNCVGDLMATVIFHPQDLSQDELKREKVLLAEYFSTGPGRDCNLKSLYFQECKHTRCTSEQAPYQHLFGETHIYEELLGLRFRIHPDSFFQVNAKAAAYLYRAVHDLSGADENTVVLDVCSGTGTISLVMAPHVRATVGVEVVLQAVEDAKYNARLNKIDNATFHYGRAEALLPQIVSTLRDRRVVAVVNPSRSGLHSKVVRAIRESAEIDRLVYISCKPQGEAMANMVALCQKKSPGLPFVPTLAVPLDMFPHTKHCELIVVMDRLRSRKKKKNQP